MSSRQTTQILEGLQSQKTGYAQLLELAKKQKAAIDTDDETRLLQLIQSKEQLLRALRETEQTLKESSDSLSNEAKKALPPQAKELQNEVLRLMEQLIQIENECAESLKSKALGTRDELADLKNRKQSIKQYGMPGTKGTEFSGDA
ncbi:flagellar export chaperone FlgN [Nitrospina watsonii]|uniref:Flagellar protein FlgN n=1 Tax=Nitrospina watsonii TaxID=1323948 RepID=A0ABN8W2D6_9BACT|nr:flagellar export chaperone FlgN [Nitrospina watsonii]CAI2717406.1 conserved protein of unknown function [Nitrospina watsonii]